MNKEKSEAEAWVELQFPNTLDHYLKIVRDSSETVVILMDGAVVVDKRKFSSEAELRTELERQLRQHLFDFYEGMVAVRRWVEGITAAQEEKEK